MAHLVSCRGLEVLRILSRYKVELQEILPRSVMESKCRKGRIFGVDEMEVEERNVLRIVEKAAARCSVLIGQKYSGSLGVWNLRDAVFILVSVLIQFCCPSLPTLSSEDLNLDDSAIFSY